MQVPSETSEPSAGGWKLNRELRKDELGVLSDLQHGGVPLDEEVLEAIKAASRGLSIFQTGSLLENSVFELDSGGSGYMLSVAICNDSNRPIRLHEFRLQLSWHDEQFHWLGDPSRASPRKSCYSFPPPGPFGIDREVVLNHHVGTAGRLCPGGQLEGFLLGMGQTAVPDEYRDRQPLPMRLLVFDRRGRPCASHLKLYVSRKGLIPVVPPESLEVRHLHGSSKARTLMLKG